MYDSAQTGWRPLDNSLYVEIITVPFDSDRLSFNDRIGSANEVRYKLTRDEDNLSASVDYRDIVSENRHFHERTTEIWTCIFGLAKLHLGDEVIILKPQETQIIKPGVRHWIKSLLPYPTPSRFIVHSQGPWDPHDHILDLD